jgi:HSP20 family protein
MVQRWNPADEMERMFSEMDRLFGDTLGRGRVTSRARSFRPAIDVYDDGEQIVMKAVIPGAQAEDLDISIEQNTVTLKGTFGYQLDEEEAKRVVWYQREIGYGQWADSVSLPTQVDPDNVSATFEDGILTLAFPKAEQARVKRIPIQSAKQLPDS